MYGGEFGPNSPPPSQKGRGGLTPPLNSPPVGQCRGCTISAEGGTRGGVVNFKVLEDSDDSPPVGGGVRGGVGSLRGDKGGSSQQARSCRGDSPASRRGFCLAKLVP